MMEKYFNYKDVPKNYLHCLNAQCPHAADCLRFQAALHAGPDTSSFLAVNPAYVADNEECPYFRPDCMVRFALGITHLFDNLPHAKAIQIKKMLYNQFKRNMFYRILNKERLIRPEEQDFIRDVFFKEEIEDEPVFDEYIDRYDWY